MGCYDIVYFKCPHCYHAVEFKSKAGECKMATYTEGSVPVEIARSIAGTTETCPNCGNVVRAVYGMKVPALVMRGE